MGSYIYGERAKFIPGVN